MRRKSVKRVACKALSLSMAMVMCAGLVPSQALAFEKNTGAYAVDETVTQYLSDWNWLSAEAGWKEVVKDGCVECSSIRLRDENGEEHTYQKGIGAHAASKIVYDIKEKGVLRFQSDVGVNKEGGTCGFTVMTDVSSEPLFQTEEPLKASDSVLHVDVAIPENATKLILLTDNGNDGEGNDHSVWAGAKVVLDADVQDNLYKVILTAPSQINIDATDRATVKGVLVDGTEADLSQVDIKYTSSDEEVLSVSETGELKGLKSGVSTLTVSVTLDGITKTTSRKILVRETENLLDSISSPDNSLKAEFCLSDKGEIQYLVKKDNEIVVETSSLGIVTDLDDFTQGLRFLEKTSVTQGVDDYDLTGAKVSHVHDTYNEVTYTFWGQNGTELKVIVRMYDDGVAFRYAVDGEGTLNVSSEKTSVKIPGNSTVHAHVYHSQHEGYPKKYTLDQLTADNYDTPMLYETENGTWGLIGEAAVGESNYCVSRFSGDGKGNVQYVNENDGKPVSIQMPYQSPWRFVVTGDAATINLTTMAENLNPDCEGDFSWVKPGATSWTWLNGDPCNDLETYKEYVDLSVEMGWQYLLMDEGWQLGGNQGQSGQSGWYGYGEWFDDLAAYAKENNIGLLAWAHNKDLQDKHTVTEDHSSELCKLLDEWKSKGIVGIKPDFFFAGTQETIAWMDTLIQETAYHEMLLDMHGCALPSGERRTYPHLLSRESVFGGEQVHWNNSKLTAYNNCLLPFTRNAVGPMDYTPMFKRLFTGHGRNWNHNFSLGQMAAMPVVFETGLQCLADKPASYLGSPAELYFEGMPAEWENSVVLEADPGSYVTIARKAKTGDWYVGAMCDAQRSAQIDMPFLDEGHTYYAIICKDDTMDTVTSEYQKVTSDTKLSIPMLQAGGAAIRIMYDEPEIPDTITLDTSELTLQAYEENTLTATTTKDGQPMEARVIWSSDNESVATVADGVVTGINPGTANITATIDGFDGTLEATCKVKVTSLLADGWEIVNGDARKHWTNVDDNTVEIEVQKGEYYFENGRPTETAKNVFLHDVENTDFEIAVTLSFQPNANYQTAGLIIYRDGTSNFAATRRYHSNFGGNVVGIHGTNVDRFTETYVADPLVTQSAIDLKIEKNGTQLTSYYSLDGRQTWTKYNDAEWKSFENASAEELKVGLYTANNSDTNEKATFKNFTIKYVQDEQETVLPLFDMKNETANKTLLQKTYDYALTLSTDGVTDTAKAAFETALANAKAVLDDEAATQDQVNAAWDALLEGIWGLGLTQGDKTMLNLLIDRAQDMIPNKDKYVADHWQQLVDALAEAQKVASDGDAMQEDVDQAAQALLDAILAQRYKADKSILKELIRQAEDMELTGYTAESVAVFRTALANAQAVLADETLTEDDQATVDAAVEQLTQAMNGLTAEGTPEATDKPQTTDKPEVTDKPQATHKPGQGNVPQTGDHSQITLWVTMMSLCAASALILVAVKGRRKAK